MQKSFSQRDVERAVRGAKNAGLPLGRVEIKPDGSIIVWSIDQQEGAEDALDNELNQWRKSNGED
jgi:hypothetical protein